MDRWAVVHGDRMRMLTVDEKREFMGFPEDTLLPNNSRVATHLLGNAVCPPVDRDIITELMKVA